MVTRYTLSETLTGCDCTLAGKLGLTADRRTLRVLRQDVLRILTYYRTIGYVSGWEAGADSLTITGPINAPWRLTP